MGGGGPDRRDFAPGARPVSPRSQPRTPGVESRRRTERRPQRTHRKGPDPHLGVLLRAALAEIGHGCLVRGILLSHERDVR